MTEIPEPDWADEIALGPSLPNTLIPSAPVFRIIMAQALRKADEQGYKRGFAAGMGVSYGGKD